MRCRQSSITIPSTRSRWLVAIIGSWTSTHTACRFRQDLFFERRVKTIFDPVRNSTARFHFPSLAEGYYWLHVVRKSRGYLDWDLGVRAHKAQNSKGAAKRRARRGEREERPFSDSLSAFSVAGNSRRYEFLVHFSFSLKFFFWFCFSFCARFFFFLVFFSLILMQVTEGGEDWRFLSVVFCFGFVGLFLNEKRMFLHSGFGRNKARIFSFLFSTTLVSIDCLILFTDSFGIWTWKVFCKCFCW